MYTQIYRYKMLKLKLKNVIVEMETGFPGIPTIKKMMREGPILDILAEGGEPFFEEGYLYKAWALIHGNTVHVFFL